MADKAISELTRATSVGTDDLFVLQQANQAKAISGQDVIAYLSQIYSEHGGIRSVTKTGTADLEDTYTITYGDATTSTFVVTNGAKGDKGDPGDDWFVHIRYSENDPTRDADVKTTPDDWIGIYSGISETAPTDYTAYTWFRIKGEKGDAGNSITGITLISSTGLTDTYRINFSDGDTTTFEVENGASIDSITLSGTSGLTDTYIVLLTDGRTTTFTVTNAKSISSITPVDVTHAAGHTDEYRINYNDGDTFTFYVYNGANGSGSVSTVDGIQAANQNVDLLELGTGAPSTSKAGKLKSRYFDTANSVLYICVGIDTSGTEPTYTWAGTGATIDSAFSSTSTNPLQNKVLTEKLGTGTMDTTAQTIVGAVNEIVGNLDTLDGSKIPVSASDTTKVSAKLSGIEANVSANAQDISDLQTTASELRILKVTMSSFSSLPQTVTNAAITTDMVCIKAELGTPSAQTGDWTVNTDTAGQVTVSGSISGSTTLTLYLAKSR